MTDFKCLKCGGDGKVLYDAGGNYYHFDCQPSREGKPVMQKRCVECQHIEDVGRKRCYMCDGTRFQAVTEGE